MNSLHAESLGLQLENWKKMGTQIGLVPSCAPGDWVPRLSPISIPI